MAGKRGNPVDQPRHSKVLSQQVVNPIANDAVVSGGNPAKMKVPAGKRTVISQQVGNPAASKK
jgi:hypothetical protein